VARNISVIFPSRGRPKSLMRTVRQLRDLAYDPWALEILVAVDPDDIDTLFAVQDGAFRVLVQNARWGYTNFHIYCNNLAKIANGDWLFLWNDDLEMQTRDWDERIREQPCDQVLWPTANHAHHANLFPAWPKVWTDTLGYVAPFNHVDTYLQHIARDLNRHKKIDVQVFHDRFDLTGNHDDMTYREGRAKLGPEGMASPVPYEQLAIDTAKVAALYA
jgi:glycosyltransferase involved in cell wall biosynthesis